MPRLIKVPFDALRSAFEEQKGGLWDPALIKEGVVIDFEYNQATLWMRCVTSEQPAGLNFQHFCLFTLNAAGQYSWLESELGWMESWWITLPYDSWELLFMDVTKAFLVLND